MNNNIYVSTSCIRNLKISESVKQLAELDFKYIELSGGTDYYSSYIEDLIELKEKFNLVYKVHNYFPPPLHHGVINLASNSDSILINSFKIIDNAYKIVDSGLAECYSFHAGFLFEMTISDLGATSTNNALIFIPQETGFSNFVKNVKYIKEKYCQQTIIENNVISKFNFVKQKGNRFLLTDSKSYLEMKKELDFKLLLDLGHLKVSVNTLDLNLENEFENLFQNSDYIHVSDNDALSDLNLPLTKDCDILNLIANSNCEGKDFTIEVYTGIKGIIKTFDLLLRNV
jgi:sugar phosphate isomerase/epimerase